MLDSLSDLEKAFTRLEPPVADVERRVELLENVRSRRGGAVVMSPIGVHQPAGGSSAQLDRVCSAAAVLGRVDQDTESASVQDGGTSIPPPSDVQGVQGNRR